MVYESVFLYSEEKDLKEEQEKDRVKKKLLQTRFWNGASNK